MSTKNVLDPPPLELFQVSIKIYFLNVFFLTFSISAVSRATNENGHKTMTFNFLMKSIEVNLLVTSTSPVINLIK